MTTLIGNALGMGDYRLALKFYRDALIIATSLIIIIQVLLITLRHEFISLFTQDESVFIVASDCLVFLALELIFDMTQAVLAGVLRGLGLIKRVTNTLMIWLWLFYVPLAIGVVFWINSLKAVYMVQAGAMIGVLITYYFTLKL